MQFVTPQKDIDWALSVEKSLQDHEKALYDEFMNNVSMSERIKTPSADGRNIRDGCILTGIFCRCKDEKWPENYYYDQVNNEWRKKDLNKGGRCQNCGSIYSCWC